MKKMKNKNKKIFTGIFAAAIILILVFSVFGFSGMLDFTIFGVNTTVSPKTITGYTGTYQFKDGPQYVHDKIRGKNILKGTTEELFDDDEYVSSWYSNGDSEKIILAQGNRDQMYGWNAGHDYVGQPRRPSALVGRYWWDIWYYPSNVDPVSGSGTKIIWKGGYNSAYVEKPDDVSFSKQEFPNAAYSTEYSSLALGGETRWWFPEPKPLDYTQSSPNLKTGAVSFKIAGQKTGTLKVQLVVEYCELCVWGLFYSVFGYHYSTAVIKEDMAILKSGVGDVDCTSQNSLKGIPGYGERTSGETGDSYTKYVYAEGQTVTMHIKTGAAGPTAGESGNDKKWRLELKKGSTMVSGYPQYFNDNYENDLTFTIPINSYVPGGDITGNTYNYVLYNGLIAQSEGKFFGVDVLDRIPGRTTIETTKSTYTLGEMVHVTCKANYNPNTQKSITKFDVWAKYGSASGTNYAYGPTFVTNIQKSGSQFTGTFSFTPTKTGQVFIRGHAIDSDGYAGAENQPDKIITVQDVPYYQLTVRVKDLSANLIQGAIVTFRNIQGQTNDQGSVILSVESGTGILSVTKSGYFTSSKQETVTGTRTIDVVLTSIEGDGDEDGETQYTIEVSVVDGTTYSAIDGATIVCGSETKTADSQGTASFLVDPGTYSITAFNSGYDSGSESVTVSTSNVPVNIYLTATGDGGTQEPGGPYTLTVETYEDATALALADVHITVDGQEQTTTSAGLTNFLLATGDYTVIATKTGYTDDQQTVTISSSDDAVSFYLVKIGETPIHEPEAKTPGFEAISLVIAIGVSLILIAKRKGRKE